MEHFLFLFYFFRYLFFLDVEVLETEFERKWKKVEQLFEKLNEG